MRGGIDITHIITLDNVYNLDGVIVNQKEKMNELRALVKTLSFTPVDPIGNYTSVSYKAIDGGKMKIEFDPFEMDLIDIADSNGREIMRFVAPKGAMGGTLDSSDFQFLNNIPEIQRFVQLLNKENVTEISEILKEARTAMEIAEFACIFERLSRENDDPIMVLKDGLLRTKAIKSELIRNLCALLQSKKEAKLVGVAKTSKLLNIISSALFMEKVIPYDKVGYVEIPLDLELRAYKWSGHGLLKQLEPLDYAFGKLYIAKLSHYSNLLVTVEIPYDLNGNEAIYSKYEVNEIFGHLIKDSMFSYPNLGYPQTIMRAHEKAVQLGFTASILKDLIMDKIIDQTDSTLKNYIRDHQMLRAIVDKGTLGGGL